MYTLVWHRRTTLSPRTSFIYSIEVPTASVALDRLLVHLVFLPDSLSLLSDAAPLLAGLGLHQGLRH